MLTKLAAHRNLLKNLVLRDLKHRYAGSVGGFCWAVIHPLVLLVSYTFVFKVVFKAKAPPGVENFTLFLFCGILPWLLFSDTVTRCCASITENTQLITKTVIPAELIPMSIALSNLIQHGIGLAILFTVLIAFFDIHASALLIFIYMPMLLMLAQGLGWIVASLQVFLRDTSQVLQIVMQLWFFFTPIFWAMESLDAKNQALLQWNPMAVLVTGYRNSLLNLEQPGSSAILIVFALCTFVFVLGAFLFRQAKPAFADVL